MAEYLIVDGYNVIYAWDMLKDSVNNDFEHARLKLIDALAEYQAVKAIKVIIVFDAHMVKGGSGSCERFHGVDVIFTAEGETADMLIERLAGQFGEKDRVVVATSDWAQQRIVFGKGAVRLSAKELEREVKACRVDIRDHIESIQNDDSRLNTKLKDDVRAVLERMRRQK